MGFELGTRLGESLGAWLGIGVGTKLGAMVVGALVGFSVGFVEGRAVGRGVGAAVGDSVVILHWHWSPAAVATVLAPSLHAALLQKQTAPTALSSFHPWHAGRSLHRVLASCVTADKATSPYAMQPLMGG